jgi:hypothetical protein
LAPSSLNCTPATATLSDALAATVTVPVAVAPVVGAVMETAGGVASGWSEYVTRRKGRRPGSASSMLAK